MWSAYGGAERAERHGGRDARARFPVFFFFRFCFFFAQREREGDAKRRENDDESCALSSLLLSFSLSFPSLSLSPSLATRSLSFSQLPGAFCPRLVVFVLTKKTFLIVAKVKMKKNDNFDSFLQPRFFQRPTTAVVEAVPLGEMATEPAVAAEFRPDLAPLTSADE